MKMMSVFKLILSESDDRKRLIKIVGNDKIVYYVDPVACESFLKKYPKVRLVMNKFINGKGSVMSKYKKFLTFKESHESELGGRPETLKSPTFGEKTFYKFDWPRTATGSDLGFAELFQYLISIKG